MKNIHLLPTDKPSRLFLNKVNSKLLLEDIANPNLKKVLPSGTYQNIYITSDEEIKEGDWFIQTTYEGVFKCSDAKIEYIYFDGDSYEPIAYCKKIILTTDPDLIKDGVQSIDDEFLEWFVKNPSCEYVEFQKTFVTNSGLGYQEYVELNTDFEVLEVVARLPQTSYIVGEITKLEPYEYIQRHKIIFPQEEPNYNMKEEIIAEMERLEQEPKQEYYCKACGISQDEPFGRCHESHKHCSCEIRLVKNSKQEERERGITITYVGKQETLEEVAEKEFPLIDTEWCRTGACEEENLHLLGHRKSFIKGAKWQQEQILQFLYSEITERRDYSASKMCEKVVEFIKQNQKK